jgi:hypothetical protein
MTGLQTLLFIIASIPELQRVISIVEIVENVCEEVG